MFGARLMSRDGTLLMPPMQEIDEAVRMFSRPRVLVRAF